LSQGQPRTIVDSPRVFAGIFCVPPPQSYDIFSRRPEGRMVIGKSARRRRQQQHPQGERA
jgi:hypothetical protein